MKQFQSTIKLKSLKNYGPSPLTRQPSILFIFNGFARNWARVLDIAGTNSGIVRIMLIFNGLLTAGHSPLPTNYI
jgi:hypothetical protein